jgi:NAD(P)H-dependent flavin oxidoreductase YrpB (nitropropane dioxygenase family)
VITSTRFTDLVGCALPLQLAAMGGVGTTELAAAVVTAGGLGMVPGSETPASATCGLNFLMPFVPPVDVVREAARSVPVVEFFYGDPDPTLVEAVHRGGALAGWQVGSGEEASAAEEAGCDYVVAQGTEAGGHVRGTQPLAEVVPAVLAAVRIPVVAAGGVATPQRFAEVMAMGVGAVRIGTRFVTSPESGAHPDYVAKLLNATGEDTVLTEWFDEGWPHAPHRVLRSAIESARTSGWRETVPPYRGVERATSDMAMYAGMGVGEVHASLPAAEVVADLVSLL